MISGSFIRRARAGRRRAPHPAIACPRVCVDRADCPTRGFRSPSVGNVPDVAATTFTTVTEESHPGRVVAAAVEAVIAIFAAVVVLVVAIGAMAYAAHWAWTLGT